MLRFAAVLLQVFVLVSLSACANFGRLKQDLEDYSTDNIEVNGVVRGSGDELQPIVVAHIKDLEQGDVDQLRVLLGDGDFRMAITRNGGWLFAFVDANRDLTYQQGEAYGWYNVGAPIEVVADKKNLNAEFIMSNGADPAPPVGLIDKSLADVTKFREVAVGKVAALDEARFAPEAAEQGLWQPYKSVTDGYAGLFMLEEYDPAREPVVFVHGINGTSRSFSAVIEGLDQSKYQVWFMNYPSGFNLDVLGGFLYQAMEVLQYRYAFDSAHVVAYSMGGLVSREYLNNCIEQKRCDYLQSYTSISSPYAGMPSASMGVEYAPTSIPVWSDLSPGSPFLQSLFVADLPEQIRFNLVFSFHTEKIIGGESSDGAVALVSQLRPEAQEQADRLWGIDDSHVGVLTNEGFLAGFNRLLVE